MGNIQSMIRKNFGDLFNMFQGKKKASIAILGLDSAGKTHLVNLFKGQVDPLRPTLGFNIEEVVICDMTIKVWDVGGQKTYVSFWRSYVRGIDGLVFMIDIADRDRFAASYDAFMSLSEDLKPGMPILFLFNKIDLLSDSSGNVDREKVNSGIEEIKEKYKIQNARVCEGTDARMFEKNFSVYMTPISVKNEIANMSAHGSGWKVSSSSIYAGFSWLTTMIKSNN